MTTLILATRNSHKTREFAAILGDGFEVHDLTDEAELPQIEETGKSFEENAILKAVEASRHFPDLVVADDSGLEVDALMGAPGIYSARYAGEDATDAENIVKLLAELCKTGAGHSNHSAVSLLSGARRQGTPLQTFEGVVEGIIVTTPRGSGGFGYDPVFQPQGFDQTFAELSPAQKNRISHRARAIRSLRQAPAESSRRSGSQGLGRLAAGPRTGCRSPCCAGGGLDLVTDLCDADRSNLVEHAQSHLRVRPVCRR